MMGLTSIRFYLLLSNVEHYKVGSKRFKCDRGHLNFTQRSSCISIFDDSFDMAEWRTCAVCSQLKYLPNLKNKIVNYENCEFEMVANTVHRTNNDGI